MSPATATPPSAEPQVTFSSGQDLNSPPSLRLIHYNDVYHLDPSSAEPVGGIARFVSVCKEYREGEKYQGQPELVTLFSGDVFNPSLESSITKGEPLTMYPSLTLPASDLCSHRQSHGPSPQPDRYRLCLCRGMSTPTPLFSSLHTPC